MKKGLLIILTLSLYACAKNETKLILTNNTPKEEVTTIHNNTPDGPKEELIKITKEDELIILVRADGAPGMYLDSSGELVGFYVELEKAVMKEMGQKFKLVPYTDIGPIIHKLKTGEIHSALAAPDAPDFRALFDISSVFEVLNYVIFINSNQELDSEQSKEHAIRSLYGKKVGVQTRGHMYQMLRDHKEIELIEFPTTTAALKALHSSTVDAVPDVKRIGLYYSSLKNWDIKPVGKPILSLNLGTAFSKALDRDLLNRYNKALEKLIDSGYVEKLYKKHFEK